MQSVSSKIWTRVTVSISINDNHYTTGTLYIYIYIYCHPQTNCFVLSELLCVARHVGRSKPGSKPIQLYVTLSLRPLYIYIYIYIQLDKFHYPHRICIFHFPFFHFMYNFVEWYFLVSVNKETSAGLSWKDISKSNDFF